MRADATVPHDREHALPVSLPTPHSIERICQAVQMEPPRKCCHDCHQNDPTEPWRQPDPEEHVCTNDDQAEGKTNHGEPCHGPPEVDSRDVLNPYGNPR